MPTTVSPRASRRSATWNPMNPAAPVTSTVMKPRTEVVCPRAYRSSGGSTNRGRRRRRWTWSSRVPNARHQRGIFPQRSSGTEIVAVRPGNFTIARRAIWSRSRFQLGVGLLIAVLLPWAVRVQVAIEELELPGLQNSLVGSAVALIAAIMDSGACPAIRACAPPTTYSRPSRLLWARPGLLFLRAP
jgi:hypothetical protein